MPCLGNSEKSCCFIKGEPCPYLIYDYTDENGHFRKFACYLRAELGSFDAVIADPRYIVIAVTGRMLRKDRTEACVSSAGLTSNGNLGH
jgi:hypothetical protein